MMQDVIITINSAQRSDPDGEDSVEFTPDGLYSYDGENACMSYMESEVTGLTGTRTSILVLPEKVVVDRDGMITSRMIFEIGRKCDFQYNIRTAMIAVFTYKFQTFIGFNGQYVRVMFVYKSYSAFIFFADDYFFRSF